MGFDLPQSIDYGKPRKPSKKTQFDKNYGLPKPKGLPEVKHEEAKAAGAQSSACGLGTHTTRIAEEPDMEKKNPKPKFKSGDKVEFTQASGKVWQGTMVNHAHYPAPNAGKHYRIDVGGMIATIFANGAVGKTVTKVEKETESEFPESVSDYEVWVKPANNGGAWCVRNSMSHATAIKEMEELQIEANENYARESLGPNKPKKREFFIVKVSESRERI